MSRGLALGPDEEIVRVAPGKVASVDIYIGRDRSWNRVLVNGVDITNLVTEISFDAGADVGIPTVGLRLLPGSTRVRVESALNLALGVTAQDQGENPDYARARLVLSTAQICRLDGAIRRVEDEEIDRRAAEEILFLRGASARSVAQNREEISRLYAEADLRIQRRTSELSVAALREHAEERGREAAARRARQEEEAEAVRAWLSRADRDQPPPASLRPIP